jgi:hypothetical protein
VTSTPAALTTLLTEKCPTFFLDEEDLPCAPYLMNHCGCGARIDDHYLRWDVRAPFSPVPTAEYAHMTLFRLPITEPVPVRCSYSVGGGHYLPVCKVHEW